MTTGSWSRAAERAAAIDILRLLDSLERLVSDGRRLPLTMKVLVDDQRFGEMLEQLRAAAPDELRQVQRLLQDRDRTLGEARNESERIARHAEEQLEFMLQGNEAIERAQRGAEERIGEARRQAEALRAEATRYAHQLLETFERDLQRQLAVVRKGLALLERREPASQ